MSPFLLAVALIAAVFACAFGACEWFMRRRRARRRDDDPSATG